MALDWAHSFEVAQLHIPVPCADRNIVRYAGRRLDRYGACRLVRYVGRKAGLYPGRNKADLRSVVVAAGVGFAPDQRRV